MQRQSSPAFRVKYHKVFQTFRHATTYDAKLVPAVKAYQHLAGITADGILGPLTFAALQGEGIRVRRQRILYAMERMRWLPHDFSDRYVFVNQPAFTAQYFEKGVEKLFMKAVVGSERHPTGFFHDVIRGVVFNPSWGMPQSIVRNEMIPRIVADRSYLTRNGYELYNNKGKRMAAHAVNWHRVAKAGGVHIRQKPGPRNALGALKIMFPNRHDIYMHDTPAKAVFNREFRAVSHGCVRLARPLHMAAAVLGSSVDKLKHTIGKKERSVALQETVPVYLAYFTAWPNAKNGIVEYFDDIYRLDKAMDVADETIRQSRRVDASHTAG